ncbi:MAG: hypothetical protein JNM31_02685 [Flavobacteriales bacterium]|nr:hypothetical protein [Flavobacteriales bacterium]
MVPPVLDVRSLRILHLALCAGCALFLAVLQVLRFQGVLPMAAGELEVLGFAAPLLLMGAPLVIWNFSRMVPRIPTHAAGTPRTLALRTALVLQWAALEAIVIFNAMAYLLTARWSTYLAAVAALAILVWRAPKEAKVELWLNGIPA